MLLACPWCIEAVERERDEPDMVHGGQRKIFRRLPPGKAENC